MACRCQARVRGGFMTVANQSRRTPSREGMRSLAYLPALFSVTFGTPAMVSMIQAIFVTHELVQPLQEIINAYRSGTALLGEILEPHLRPVLRWFASFISWEIELLPRWRDLFVLFMAIPLAGARQLW